MTAMEKEHFQERSRRSAEEILDAAVTVIATEGFRAFTMNTVAAEAGGSIGKVYARYSNKEALLFAVKDRTYRTLETRVTEALSHATTTTEVVSYFVSTVSTAFFSAPRLYSFVVSHSADDPELHGRGFAFHRHIRDNFVSRLHDCGVTNDAMISNVYEMIIQSLLMRVLSLGVVADGATPYPGFPNASEYEEFLTCTALHTLGQ